MQYLPAKIPSDRGKRAAVSYTHLNLNLSKAAEVTISDTTIAGSIKTAVGANVAIKDNSTVTGEVTGFISKLIINN